MISITQLINLGIKLPSGTLLSLSLLRFLLISWDLRVSKERSEVKCSNTNGQSNVIIHISLIPAIFNASVTTLAVAILSVR